MLIAMGRMGLRDTCISCGSNEQASRRASSMWLIINLAGSKAYAYDYDAAYCFAHIRVLIRYTYDDDMMMHI